MRGSIEAASTAVDSAGGHAVQLGEYLLGFGFLLDAAGRERGPARRLPPDGRPEVLLLGGLVLRHAADQRVGELAALLAQLRGRLGGPRPHHGLQPVPHLLHLAVAAPSTPNTSGTVTSSSPRDRDCL
jgi:hypothetical protein